MIGKCHLEQPEDKLANGLPLAHREHIVEHEILREPMIFAAIGRESEAVTNRNPNELK